MSGHLGWDDVRASGMGPGAQGCQREKSLWGQCEKNFACHPEGSGFCPLDSQEAKKAFIRSDRVTIVPWLCSSALS